MPTLILRCSSVGNTHFTRPQNNTAFNIRSWLDEHVDLPWFFQLTLGVPGLESQAALRLPAGNAIRKDLTPTSDPDILTPTSAVIGGGKFANGAETAAFAHIFNDGFTGEHSGAKWNRIGPPPYIANAQASLAQQLTDFIAGAWDGFNIAVDHLIYNVAKPEGIPDNWKEGPTDKSGGREWVNPDNPGDRVRSYPGNPNSSNPAQQNPYVRDVRNGNQWLDVNGTELRVKMDGTAHQLIFLQVTTFFVHKNRSGSYA